FQREAYRVPRFEVMLHGPNRVPTDRSFTVELTADYYAGGRVAGQQVDWSVSRYPYSIQPAGYPGFVFASDQRISGGRTQSGTSVTTRRDVTNENGFASIEVDPSTVEQVRALRYVIEAEVQGADSQSVAAVKQVIALPPFSIGLKVERFIREGSVISPQVLVVDHEEEPLAGKEFTLRLYQRQWHSYLTQSDITTGEARYTSDVVDELVYEQEYISTDSPFEIDVPVDDSGIYVVEVLARDRLGRLQQVSQDLYLAGETPAAWRRTEANVFETVLSRNEYEPGDEVELLLKSPFQDAHALVIAETPQGNRYSWVDIRNGQGVFTMAVMENYPPGFHIHTLLMRGRLPGTAQQLDGRVDRGRPISMANTTYVPVATVRHELNVELEHQEQVLPGQEAEMEIRVTDFAGNPVNGQIVLWLVDRAVLSLAQEGPIDPLQAFIDPVSSYLTLRDTRNQTVGNLPTEQTPGGGGYYEPTAAEDEVMRLMEQTTVRRNFSTVPFFDDEVQVTNGRAVVNIPMPDNLTDFAVRAVAVSQMSMFGTAESVISIRLPVIVQSSLPRLLRPGDEFSAGGIARLVEGEEGAGSAGLQLEGLVTSGGQTSASREIMLNRGEPVQVYFPIRVPRDAEDGTLALVRLGVERLSDSAADAFETQLPVSTGLQEVYLENTVMPAVGEEVEIPEAQSAFQEGSMVQSILITRDSELLRLLTGLEAVRYFQPRSTEQRVSAVYPGIVLRDIFDNLGIDWNTGITSGEIDSLISYLETVTDDNGLYAYWPGTQGYVSLTAYVFQFLAAARGAGYFVEPDILRRTARSLEQALRSDYRYFISGYSFEERVDALYGLALFDRFNYAYAEDLLRGARNQSLYSMARMIDVYYRSGRGDNPVVQELVDLLWERSVFRLVDGEEQFAGLDYSRRYWGGPALSSETRTLSAVIAALLHADPDSPRLQLMIDDLVRRGDDLGWGGSRRTASALLTLARVISSDPPVQNRHVFRLGTEEGTEELVLSSERFIQQSLYAEAQPVLTYLEGPEDQPPFVWVRTRYFPAFSESGIPAESDGFVVNREFQIVEDNAIINRIQIQSEDSISLDADTIIEEHVTITSSEDHYFAAVEIPVPAGCEIMNPNLDISSSEAVPQGRLTREPDYVRYLDGKVVFYYQNLPAGTYHFYFREKASFSGAFSIPPASADLLYDPRTYGSSEGALLNIRNME
ncbi:MAG: alpha-2-macroglobulin family protein, partial [Spirochaetia bacterium]